MASTRSPLIYGRIYRELLERGFSFDHFVPEQIYDEMRMAQDEIIAFVGLEKVIDVPLEEDTAKYSLAQNDKEVIESIKSIITPDDWNEDFIMVQNNEWDAILKSEEYNTQPVRGTLIENVLNVFPTPDSSYDGDTLQFIVNLKASIANLSATVDPELPSIFDKEIEWLTLYFITNDLKFYNTYFESVQRKQNLSQTGNPGEVVRECNW